MTHFRSSLVAVPAFLLLQGLLVAPALGASPYRSAPATSPRALALASTDVTAAFGRGFTRQVSPLSATNPLTSLMNTRVGRTSQYIVQYVRTHPGPTVVQSEVDLYKSAGLATVAIRRTFALDGKARFHAQHVPDLGQAAAVFSYDLGGQTGAHLRELGVLFSRGVYGAGVILVTAGSLDRGKLVSLARTLDSRIKSAQR